MRRAAIALATMLLGARTASAQDSMRCPRGTIELGATTDDVRARCGEPTTSRHEELPVWLEGVVARTVIDTWTYDRGPNQLTRILTFVDGTLRTIELGDYGKPR
jgi:hypothetical protein